MSPEEMHVYLSNRFNLRGAWVFMAALAAVPVWFLAAGGIRWNNVPAQVAELLR